MSTPEISPEVFKNPCDPFEAYETALEAIDSGAFHSAKDSEIARQVASNLYSRVSRSPEMKDQFFECITALKALIPVMNSKGMREIDGKTVTPTLEMRIASRANAPEIDIFSSEGSLGSLPDEIREQLLKEEELFLALTTGCTVGCGFCYIVPDKGPIQNKASFDSIVRAVYEHNQNRPTKLSWPNLYGASDPFDAKWVKGDNERDYNDLFLALKKLENVSNCELSLRTTTSVPLGEEMRVLKFGTEHADYYSRLRLSRTPANKQRLDHIEKILDFLSPPYQEKTFYINDVISHISRSGKVLLQTPVEEVTAWDIAGPDCNSGVEIGPNSLTAMYLMGATSTNPNGSLRRPIESRNVDEHGNSIVGYQFPQAYSTTTRPIQMPFTTFRPPLIEQNFVHGVDSKGDPSTLIHSETAQLESPHHHAGRLAEAIHLLRSGEERNGYRITLLTEVQYFLDDARKLVKYLEEHNDPIIDALLDMPFPTDPPKSARQFLAEIDAQS